MIFGLPPSSGGNTFFTAFATENLRFFAYGSLTVAQLQTLLTILRHGEVPTILHLPASPGFRKTIFLSLAGSYAEQYRKPRLVWTHLTKSLWIVMGSSTSQSHTLSRSRTVSMTTPKKMKQAPRIEYTKKAALIGERETGHSSSLSLVVTTEQNRVWANTDVLK